MVSLTFTTPQVSSTVKSKEYQNITNFIKSLIHEETIQNLLGVIL